MVAGEVVGAQEQEDAPARLVANAAGLLGRRGTGEQQRGAARRTARRQDPHPSLALFGDRRVLQERETERPAEEGDRLVIVADEEGDVGERLHGGRISWWRGGLH